MRWDPKVGGGIALINGGLEGALELTGSCSFPRPCIVDTHDVPTNYYFVNFCTSKTTDASSNDRREPRRHWDILAGSSPL